MMKKNLVIIFFMLISTPLLAWTGDKKYPVASIPKDLLEGSNAVLRLDENSFEVVSKGKGIYWSKWACTILNAHAERHSILYLRYDKLKSISYIKGTVYDRYGNEVRKLKKSEIQDQSAVSSISLHEDNRVKIADLSYHQYPYTVEFEVEEVYHGLLYYPGWQPQKYADLAVESSSYRVTMPKDLPLRYKELNVPLYEEEQGVEEKEEIRLGATKSEAVKITSSKGKTIYTWNVRNIPVQNEEPFSLNWRERVATVYVAPSDFEMEGYAGNMNTWAEYGKWINLLNEGRNDLPENTKLEIQNLVKNIPDKKEKVRKVYEYLQGKTRYVSIQLGIGGWQPFRASLVDEKSYGDCKALSNYTKSLLEAIDITSHYVLVKAGKEVTPLLRDFPSTQFNHAFLCVPLKKDTVWLECTSQTQAFGYTGNFTGDRDVLLITPEGGKVVHTPVYSFGDNLLERTGAVVVQEDGDANAEITTEYKALQEGVREFLVERSPKEQKKWLYEEVKIPAFEIESFSLHREKSEIPVTTEKLRLLIRKCASKSGKRLFLQPNLLNKWTFSLKKMEERASEVVLDENFDFTEEEALTYQIPDSFEIEYLPNPIHIKTVFGEYTASFTWENQKLVYSRTLKMQRGRFPKEAYIKLRQFFKEIARADKTKVVWVNKEG